MTIGFWTGIQITNIVSPKPQNDDLRAEGEEGWENTRFDAAEPPDYQMYSWLFNETLWKGSASTGGEGIEATASKWEDLVEILVWNALIKTTHFLPP